MTWEQAATQFTQALASSDPTPGGGAAAAMAGSMGCALACMAIATTLKRKSTPSHLRPQLEQSHQKLLGLQTLLNQLMQQDAKAYAAYLSATKLPTQNPTREQIIADALWHAACVPADTAKTCVEAITLIDEVENHIAAIILSDAACAKHLLKGALACSAENIRTNLQFIKDPKKGDSLRKLLEQLPL